MNPEETAEALSKDNVTQALQALEQIYDKHGISDAEKNDIDIVLSAFHHFQLLNRQGRFYEAVKYLLTE